MMLIFIFFLMIVLCCCNVGCSSSGLCWVFVWVCSWWCVYLVLMLLLVVVRRLVLCCCCLLMMVSVCYCRFCRVFWYCIGMVRCLNFWWVYVVWLVCWFVVIRFLLLVIMCWYCNVIWSWMCVSLSVGWLVIFWNWCRLVLIWMICVCRCVVMVCYWSWLLLWCLIIGCRICCSYCDELLIVDLLWWCLLGLFWL